MIRVDGARIPPPRRHRYLVLNKPRGVVATMDDPEGRRTIADLLAEPADRRTARSLKNERLFHVGRLDTDSEGLLVLTNDGEFAHRLAPLLPGAEDLRRRGDRGTERADREAPAPRHHPRRRASAAQLSQDHLQRRRQDLLKITLQEGRNRIVRRTMEAVGHPVRRLTRIGIGPVRLGNLKVGEYRELTREELGGLLDLTGG